MKQKRKLQVTLSEAKRMQQLAGIAKDILKEGSGRRRRVNEAVNSPKTSALLGELLTAIYQEDFANTKYANVEDFDFNVLEDGLMTRLQEYKPTFIRKVLPKLQPSDLGNYLKSYKGKDFSRGYDMVADFLKQIMQYDPRAKAILDYFKKCFNVFKGDLSEYQQGYLDRLNEALQSFVQNGTYSLEDLAGMFEVAYDEYIFDEDIKDIKDTPYFGEIDL